MKRKTILIVPPRGVPLKAFRVRLSVAVFLVVFVIIGVTGLFFPFNTITDDVSEQNQKINLTEQNKALLQKVITTLRLLKELKGQVTRLEQKKNRVIQVSGNVPVEETVETQQTLEYSKLKTDELLTYVNKIERRFNEFYPVSRGHPVGNVFDTLPVLKPIPEPAHISRRFGVALDPFSGKKRRHNGTDFVAEEGTPVIATASGIVKRVERHAIWGKMVTIRNGASITTVYAHLGEITTTLGKRVRRGEVIGNIGLSGLSSGPHVHYEIRIDDNPINPEEYLFPGNLFVMK